MAALKYSDSLLTLPQIHIEAELEKHADLYVNTEADFDPYMASASGSNILLSLKSVLSKAELPEESKFAIVSHYLNAPSVMHYHDYLEMIYVPRGRVLNIVEGEAYVMMDNSFFIIKPEVSHLVAPLSDEKEYPLVVNILIHPDTLRILETGTSVNITNNLAELIISSDGPRQMYFPKEVFSTAAGILNILIVEFYQSQYRLNYSLIGQLLILIDKLNDLYTNTSVDYDSLTLNCLALIESQYTTITLKGIAQSFSYSEGYLSRHIKKQTGKSVSQLITEKKLHCAEKYLVDTSMPISKIAGLVGYLSESYFYQAFKKQYHITPMQYRELMKHK